MALGIASEFEVLPAATYWSPRTTPNRH